jgi:hypothetical protein
LRREGKKKYLARNISVTFIGRLLLAPTSFRVTTHTTQLSKKFNNAKFIG